jgi:hypothetical protein
MRMIGWMDIFPTPMRFLGYHTKKWIRTNCFLISYSLLKKIDLVPGKLTNESLFSHDTLTFFNNGGLLGKDYQAYLRAWLFDEPAPWEKFKGRWYNREPLSDDNLAHFESKTLSIICEHSLSAEAMSYGGRLVPVNRVKKDTVINRLRIKLGVLPGRILKKFLLQ